MKKELLKKISIISRGYVEELMKVEVELNNKKTVFEDGIKKLNERDQGVKIAREEVEKYLNVKKDELIAENLKLSVLQDQIKAELIRYNQKSKLLADKEVETNNALEEANGHRDLVREKTELIIKNANKVKWDCIKKLELLKKDEEEIKNKVVKLNARDKQIVLKEKILLKDENKLSKEREILIDRELKVKSDERRIDTEIRRMKLRS